VAIMISLRVLRHSPVPQVRAAVTRVAAEQPRNSRRRRYPWSEASVFLPPGFAPHSGYTFRESVYWMGTGKPLGMPATAMPMAITAALIRVTMAPNFAKSLKL